MSLFSPEQEHIQTFPKATERKKKVGCTFLANGRAGAGQIFSCHSSPEQDHIQTFPKDDN